MRLSDNNRVVHGLWIGKVLSTLELLTIKSFLYHGHIFKLWVYDEIETPIPDGAMIMDANEILSSDRIFRYNYKDQYGHGKGSLAGYSDIFRYKLLHLHGGWWVDMDVTCLKPLEFEASYVFRPHHDMPVVGNVMKCPKGSDLMKYCYERASIEVDKNNRDWHLPIQILNDGIENYGLSKYIINITNSESWYENRKLILKHVNLPDSWYAIHWINEEWRRNGINKNYSGRNSVLRKLFRKHELPICKLSLYQRLLTSWRLRFPLGMAIQNPWAYKYLAVRMYYKTTSPIKYIGSKVYWFFKLLWLKHGTRAWGYVDYYIKKYLQGQKRYYPVNRNIIKKYNHHLNRKTGQSICYAPLKNMYFGIDGLISSCCFNRTHIFGKYPDNHLIETWNGDLKKKLWNHLKNNDLSQGCIYCRECLDASNFDAVAARYYDPIKKVRDWPASLEFELDNTCNLECVMCEGKFSSSIRKNREKLPPIEIKYDQNFVTQLEPFIPHLEITKFMGGEPFLINIYWEIWEKIIELNPDSVISTQTNGTVLNDRVKDILQRGRFQIEVSVDSLRKEVYERIRVNADFDKVMENIKYFIAYGKKRDLPVYVAVCPMRMNWKELPEIINFCNKYYIPVGLNRVWKPFEHALWNLPAQELKEIHDWLSERLPTGNGYYAQKNLQQYQGFLSQLKSWHTDTINKGEVINKEDISIEKLKNLAFLNIENFVTESGRYSKLEKAEKYSFYKNKLQGLFDMFDDDDTFQQAMVEFNKIPVNEIVYALDKSASEKLLIIARSLMENLKS